MDQQHIHTHTNGADISHIHIMSVVCSMKTTNTVLKQQNVALHCRYATPNLDLAAHYKNPLKTPFF